MRVFSFSRKKKEKKRSPSAGAEALAFSLSRRAEAAGRRSYLGYLLVSFRSTSPYALWQRARDVFAPAIFLSRVFRVLRWVFRILEASALFLFAVAILLLAAPFFLAALLMFAAAALFDSRHVDRELAPEIEGRRVLVLFANGGGSARAFASLTTDYTVLLVTPLFSAKDSGARSFSMLRAAHRREDGVILVREYYYFHLARKLLPRATFCARIY